MNKIEQIDEQLLKINQTLKDYANKKCFLTPNEIQNLLKSTSDLLMQKKQLLNEPIYTESKFNNLFNSILESCAIKKATNKILKEDSDETEYHAAINSMEILLKNNNVDSHLAEQIINLTKDIFDTAMNVGIDMTQEEIISTYEADGINGVEGMIDSYKHPEDFSNNDQY